MSDKDKALTYEELEAHVDKYLPAVQAAAAKPQAAGASAEAAIPNVCPAYKLVRPILQAVLLIPFISAKIKNAIKAFMKVMDAICP
jgi:hypothetical protein